MIPERSVLRIEAKQDVIYVSRDERLFEAMVGATQSTLDLYDDAGLLSRRQARLVAKIKRVVLDELRREVPEPLAVWNPWHFSRALGAYITQETRKRQFAAFERRLTDQYGPIGPVDWEDLERRTTVVNGVRIVATSSPQGSETPDRDRAE